MKTIHSPAITKAVSPPTGGRRTGLSPALKIKRIVVPVDFSEAGRPALLYAKSFAKLADASLCLVHVMEPIYSGGQIYPGPRIDYVQLDTAAMRERVSRELGSLQSGILRGIKTNFEIREGSAFHEIVTVASDLRADLIIMATHGYTGLKHIVMGSTTERVVRHAACPVLVVRSRELAKTKPALRSAKRRANPRKKS